MLQSIQMRSKSRIILFSREVHSGKTTELLELLEHKVGIGGILCPNKNGRKHAMFLPERKTYPLESNGEKSSIKVGNYILDKTILKKISDYLAQMKPHDFGLIVVDEIGKLELKNEGYEPGLSRLIQNFHKEQPSCSLILVVRDSLLLQVIEKYKLENYEVAGNIRDVSNFIFG